MATVRLSPPSAPFTRIKNPGESITINTAGKVLVLPTGNSTILPSFNEYVLNSNRLTIAESPFGGLKGAGSLDYAVGTLYTPTDGVYLTDINGNNSTKTLTAGKLKELTYLTVDTTAKTITEEFIIQNDNPINSNVVVDAGTVATGWSYQVGTGTVESVGGRLKFTAQADATGFVKVWKNYGSSFNDYPFIKMDFEPDTSGRIYFDIYDIGLAKTVRWDNARFPVSAGVNKTWTFPINAPLGTTGMNPSLRSAAIPINKTNLRLYVGMTATANANVVFYIDNLTAEAGCPAYVEVAVPDYLADTSIDIQSWNGSAYLSCRTAKLDSTYADVVLNTANCYFLDGMKVDDIHGVGLGRAVFPKGSSGNTVTGSLGTMIYSALKGTAKRIGIKLDLPSYGNGVANSNKSRFRIILSYSDSEPSSIPDLSINDYIGKLYGGFVKYSDRVFLDGSTGYIQILRYTNYNFNTPFVMEFDFICTSISSNNFLIGKYTNFFLRTEPTGLIKLGVYDTSIPGASYTTTVGGLISAGVRYKIRLEYVGTKFHIYLDGVECTYAAQPDILPANIATSTYSILLGKRSDGYFFNGAFYGFYLSVGGTKQVEYKPTLKYAGSTAYEFTDSTNASYGLQNMSRPWIALYDPAGNYIDFFLFTHRPKNLVRKRDDSGNIYEMTLYPGNGSIYRGRITNALLTADSNSNLIPDCLESSIEGSVTKFLSSYGMVV